MEQTQAVEYLSNKIRISKKRKFIETKPLIMIKRETDDDDDDQGDNNHYNHDTGDNASVKHAYKAIKTEASSSSENSYQNSAGAKTTDTSYELTYYSAVFIGVATYCAYEVYNNALPALSYISEVTLPDAISMFSVLDVF